MKIRYLVLAMLVLLSVITYLDRICIGVSAKDIQADLGISEEGWGWVLGAFLLAYGLFEIPSGGLGDRVGQRKVLTRIVLWWSAFTALTPFARNYYLLVATRFLFGAGEAGAYPNASGCISRWFPADERARAQGLVWGASRLGGALTPLIVVPLKTTLGWQACFWLFGALGVVWAIAWAIWFRDDPAQHPAVGPDELAELNMRPASSVAVSAELVTRPLDKSFVDSANKVRDQALTANLKPYAAPSAYGDVGAMRAEQHASATHANVPWAALFASPQLWLIVAMYWFYVFGFIFFMFWLPKYLTQGRGLSQEAMAICVALTFSAGFFGNLIGGWTSDRLSKRYGLAIGRKVIGVTCLALSGVLLFVAVLVPGKFTTAALMIASFGIADGMLPCAWAICLDVGRQYSGAVSGAMNSAGQAAGYICTVLFGYLVAAYGYDWPLLFLAPNLLIAAVLFALIDPTKPLVPEIASPATTSEPACV